MSNGPARAKQERDCDECSRKQVEIARVYRGHRYCRTCYTREFKHRTCPGCGETARLPREFPKADCRKCERNRPCVRCGRKMARMGLRTPHGPACGPCAPYFREEEACEACGRSPGASLASPALVTTCGSVPDVRVPTTEHAHGASGPGYSRRTRAASGFACGVGSKARFRARAAGSPCRQAAGTSASAATSRAWQSNGRNSTEPRSGPLRLLGISGSSGSGSRPQGAPRRRRSGSTASCRFSWEIEREWGTIPEYGTLLEHFGAKKLRSVLLAMRWMEESGLVKPDSAVREADSDRRRIEATLDQFPEGSRAREILEEYHDTLEERVEAGRTNTRSVRLAIAPGGGAPQGSNPGGQDGTRPEGARWILEKDTRPAGSALGIRHASAGQARHGTHVPSARPASSRTAEAPEAPGGDARTHAWWGDGAVGGSAVDGDGAGVLPRCSEEGGRRGGKQERRSGPARVERRDWWEAVLDPAEGRQSECSMRRRTHRASTCPNAARRLRPLALR